MSRPKTERVTSNYRLSVVVDAWLAAEAERLGVSKNAVIEMTLRAAMERAEDSHAPTKGNGRRMDAW